MDRHMVGAPFGRGSLLQPASTEKAKSSGALDHSGTMRGLFGGSSSDLVRQQSRWCKCHKPVTARRARRRSTAASPSRTACAPLTRRCRGSSDRC
jgi:hypothetical protein